MAVERAARHRPALVDRSALAGARIAGTGRRCGTPVPAHRAPGSDRAWLETTPTRRAKPPPTRLGSPRRPDEGSPRPPGPGVVAPAGAPGAGSGRSLGGVAAAVAAGMLLRGSFPPLNWWWAAVLAFALLSWVLTRPATTTAGGFGYGLLFGLAFYLPLLPWVGGLVGRAALADADADVCAVSGGVRAAGRRGAAAARLAGLVRAAVGGPGVAEIGVPVRRVPLGRGGIRPDRGPAAAAGRARRGAAAVDGRGVDRLQPATASTLEIVRWLRESRIGRDHGATGRPPAVLLPGLCICLVLLTAVVVWPRSGAPARARVTTRPSRWRPCRATCRGSGWTSMPSAGRCWTITSAKPCDWPRTSRPGGPRNRCS